jgi:quercetin dioxygenase-like cupin family protein
VSQRPEVKEKRVVNRGVKFAVTQVKSVHDRAIMVGRASFAPGASLPCHLHNCDETITILDGTAFSEVRGKRYKLARYDTLVIPAGLPHRSGNASPRRKMVMLCLWNSRDVERHILDLQQCTDQGAELQNSKGRG